MFRLGDSIGYHTYISVDRDAGSRYASTPNVESPHAVPAWLPGRCREETVP